MSLNLFFLLSCFFSLSLSQPCGQNCHCEEETKIELCFRADNLIAADVKSSICVCVCVTDCHYRDNF